MRTTMGIAAAPLAGPTRPRPCPVPACSCVASGTLDREAPQVNTFSALSLRALQHSRRDEHDTGSRTPVRPPRDAHTAPLVGSSLRAPSSALPASPAATNLLPRANPSIDRSRFRLLSQPTVRQSERLYCSPRRRSCIGMGPTGAGRARVNETRSALQDGDGLRSLVIKRKGVDET
jgi:hypothetical protein